MILIVKKFYMRL